MSRISQARSLGPLLKEWHILRQNIPKGFEKYYKGGNKSPPKQSSDAAPKPKGITLFCVFIEIFEACC